MRRYLFPLFILGIVLMPTIASAAWFPIVPCGGSTQAACTACDLFKTFKNIIDLVLYGITGPIAAFMIVWAGGMMLAGGANPAWYGQGTKMLQNTLIGVTIILLSWLATNTLIKTLASGNAYDAWYEFSCPTFLEQAPASVLPAPVPEQGSAEKPATILVQASVNSCSAASLATANKVPNNTKLNSPGLEALISCVLRDPIVARMYDKNQLFTYELTNPLCNLTHGSNICGSCQHSKGSCHYGGKTGIGAMAVDFNVSSSNKTVTYEIKTRSIVAPGSTICSTTEGACRTVSGETGLFDEIYRAAVKNGCDFKFINYESGSGGAHTHLSTKQCDSDGVGTGKLRQAPILP